MELNESNLSGRYLVFTLEEQRFALPIEIAKVVVRMVEVMAVPGAENSIDGVVNYHGEIIPVVDLKRKLGFGTQEANINAHMIIIQHKGEYSALVVDKVMEVIKCTESSIKPISELAPETTFYRGVTKYVDGIVLLNRIEDVLPGEQMEPHDFNEDGVRDAYEDE